MSLSLNLSFSLPRPSLSYLLYLLFTLSLSLSYCFFLSYLLSLSLSLSLLFTPLLTYLLSLSLLLFLSVLFTLSYSIPFFLTNCLSLSYVLSRSACSFPLSLSSYLSFSPKACIEISLESFFKQKYLSIVLTTTT